MTRHLILPLAFLAIACADNTDAPVETDTGATDTGAIDTDTETTHTDDTAPPAETVALSIDATDEAAWTHLDLSTGAATDASGSWTLGFQRATVKVNGGVSGEAGVMAQLVDDSLDAGMDVPEDGWIDDTVGGDGTAFWAFDGWYIYDSTNHTLAPTPGTWLVKQADGTVHGVVIDSYYDEHGTSAVYQLTTLKLRDAQ